MPDDRAEDARVLDLRSIASGDRLALVRNALFDLRDTDTGYLTVTSDEDAEPLLAELTRDLPTLRWSALGAEPPPFRYAVFAAIPDDTESLLGFLTWQDELLDERLDMVDELASELPRLADAVPAARSFEESLGHHAEIEERLLFPLLEPLCPDSKTLARLRSQHAALRDLAADVTAALLEQDSRRFIAAMDALQSALSGHHAIEQALMECIVVDDAQR